MTQENALPYMSRMRGWLLPAGVLLCGGLALTPALALALGVVAAFCGADATQGNWNKRAHWLLQASVVTLGAGINLPQMMRAGVEGLGVTLVSICAILLLGEFAGRCLNVPRHTRNLISAGTAICGGSAIAAIAGVLKPRQHETAAALGVVFVLNAAALLIFPAVGHLLNLSQNAFGWWAALAIHDTSSVVGAGMAYGSEALKLATTVKLARALWIVPVALVFATLENRRSANEISLSDAPLPGSTGKMTAPSGMACAIGNIADGAAAQPAAKAITDTTTAQPASGTITDTTAAQPAFEAITDTAAAQPAFESITKSATTTQATAKAASRGKISFPWFILGFVALATVRWILPQFSATGDAVATAGLHGLSASLFLIGAGLSPRALHQVGWSPCLLGICIWIPTAAAALIFALYFR